MALIQEFVAGRLPPALYQAYLTPLFETWSDLLVEQVPPQGQVLDLACGTGIVTRKLSQQPGVKRTLGIDIAEPMIDAARAATSLRSAIEYQVASADKIDCPDEQFDEAYCQQGLQFFPDKAAALAEVHRLLKPGAAAAFAVWTSAADGNPAFGSFEAIVGKECGADLVPFGPFSYGDKGTIADLADQSPLSLVSIQRFERLTPLPDPRTLVLFDLLFLGRPAADGSMHPLFDPADGSHDEQIERMIARLEIATRDYSQADGGLLAPSAAHLVVLKKD